MLFRSLGRLGYQPGRADGRLTPETIRSIREFEMDNGLIPSGRVSADLVTALDRKLGPQRSH